MPGFVTGAAGLLTALVGLLGLSVQLGWIGGGNSGDSTKTSTSSSALAGPSTSTFIGSGAGGTGSTGHGGSSGSAKFTVDPTSVDFAALGSRQATVTVRNSGEQPLTVKTPTVTGTGSVHFVAGDVNCTAEPLLPGRTCQVQVAFSPKAGGAVSAVLVISAAEASKQVEVQVKGTSLLG
jgi:hypothetical protein